MHPNRRLRVTAVVLAAGVAAGLGATLAVNSLQHTTRDQQQLANPADVLARQAGLDGGASLYNPAKISDVLPSVSYSYQGTTLHETSLVVSAAFQGWSPVAAYTFTKVDPASGSGTKVAFTDPDAAVHIYALKLRLSDVLGAAAGVPEVTAGDNLTAQLRVDGPVDSTAFIRDLLKTANPVVFLKYDADSKVFEVAENGTLIEAADASGKLTLLQDLTKGSTSKESAGLVNDLPSITQLRDAARNPKTVEVVLPTGAPSPSAT